MLIETERLVLRPLTPEDEPALSECPQRCRDDAVVSAASDSGMKCGRGSSGRWDGIRVAAACWAMIEKATGELIGDCGPVWQEIEGRAELEIGYHVNRERWNQGFASEAARAVMDYAFRRFDVERVVSMIRPENVASRRVAEKNGLTVERVVLWRDYDHCIYQRAKK